MPPLVQESPGFRACKAIGWAGLLAGLLDISTAFVEAALERKSPIYLLQAIAGGWLGEDSFHDGLASAALGLFFHFLIAFTAAAVFYMAATKLAFLKKHPLAAGVFYGIAIYAFMSYVVMPLSAYHVSIVLPRIATFTKDVAVHIVMVGVPIALMVRKYSA